MIQNLFKTGPLSLYRSKNSSLFEGMVFMLTHVEKSAQSRAYEKQMLQYSSLDTSVDESTDIGQYSMEHMLLAIN